MKRQFKRVTALACALLFTAAIFAGIPEMNAKANDIVTTRPNEVVQEGTILSNAEAVFYLKPGMSEAFFEYMRKNYLATGESLPYYLHEDYGRDAYTYVNQVANHEVLAPENGSDAYIIRIHVAETSLTNEVMNIYLLEPYTAPQESGSSDDAAPAYAAPVYVYVEPAWLTTWKGLLTGIDKQIADAKAGDTVILDLGEYYNISNARMQQIAEKNDVTFILNMTYDKVSYSLTIKPGTEIDLGCDWYGPLKLLSMFPYEVVE